MEQQELRREQVSCETTPVRPMWRRAPENRSHIPSPNSSSGPSSGSAVAAALLTAEELVTRARELESVIIEATRWTPDDRLGVIEALDRVQRLVLAAHRTVTAAHTEAGTWQVRGDRNPGAHMGRVTRAGTAAGKQFVAEGKALQDLPQVARGFKDGTLTTQHLARIAKVYDSAPESVADTMRSEEGQAALVGYGAATDGTEFAKKLTAWKAAVDPQANQRSHDAQHAARSLTLFSTDSGTRFVGLVDNVAGGVIRRALEATVGVPSANDDRTREQRLADALTAMATNTLSDTRVKTGALVRPHVSLTIREETWNSLRSAGSPLGGTTADGALPLGGATHVAWALRDVAPVIDDDGLVLPGSRIGQILCDCEITRIVIDADGKPVDLGRTSRLYTDEQRRAVLARDHGCVWNGCDLPGRWCEIHHIDWWTRDNGATSVENGAALCTYHHGLVHSMDLTITRTYGTGGPSAGDAAGGGAGVPGTGGGVSSGAGVSGTGGGGAGVSGTGGRGACVSRTSGGGSSPPGMIRNETRSGSRTVEIDDVTYTITTPRGRVMSRRAISATH